MATVLILATDSMIAGLLGQLAELTGHAAQFRRAGEEASEAVRAARPDVVMLDAAYGRSTIEAVTEAAASVEAKLVYFAPTLPPLELRRYALERGAKYFALPAGPKLLARILADALATRPGVTPVGDLVSSCRDAVEAAAAAVARARLLSARAADLRSDIRALRAEREAALAECRRSQAALRDAVIAYTRELREAGVSPERTLEMVRGALGATESGQRLPADVGRDMDDAMEWCIQAYYAA